MTIVCFGELLLRLTPPGNRRLVQAASLGLVAGGAEPNVAAGLASLGRPVRMTSLAANNALGDLAVNALRAVGVDTSWVARKPGRMGLYFLEAGAGIRPSTITYDRAGSAFAEADPADIDLAGAMAGAKLLHVGGITPALGPKGGKLARAAQDAALAAGTPISFDGNWRGNLWAAWDSRPGEILRDLAADATLLIGNHRDISLMLDRSYSGDTAQDRRAAALAAFEAFPKLQLIAATGRKVMTSDHHRIIARVDSRTDQFETPEIDIAGIVDRIGAGDAFATGVIHQWTLGGSLEDMARTGQALAAIKHSIPGDLCLIDQAALDAFAVEGGDIRR